MFGSRLKKLRKEKNLTQTELGKIINVSASTIGMYERENRKPTPETLNQIADYFEVTTDYLLGRTNQKYFKQDETISFHAKGELNDEDMKMVKDLIDRLVKEEKEND
mgnify:CR=1 FL=1